MSRGSACSQSSLPRNAIGPRKRALSADARLLDHPSLHESSAVDAVVREPEHVLKDETLVGVRVGPQVRDISPVLDRVERHAVTDKGPVQLQAEGAVAGLLEHREELLPAAAALGKERFIHLRDDRGTRFGTEPTHAAEAV